MNSHPEIDFPKNLYTDIRLEDVFSTQISYENGILKQNKQKSDRGAMIRIFDGDRWFYSATTDLSNLQAAVDELAGLAAPNPWILEHPVMGKLEVNRETLLRYEEKDIRLVPRSDKQALIQSQLPLLASYPEIVNATAVYLDTHTIKQFISSLGADLKFDCQICAAAVRYDLKVGEKPLSGREFVSGTAFADLGGGLEKFKATIEKDIEFARHSRPVEPGVYTCILSPAVTGVFAHESFGHKSEADFMIGDETMKREWAIGSRVGVDSLTIVDSGLPEGAGYVPFDDEGCRAKKNYLIRNGILAGRLHSSITAAALDELPTGNARATTFEFEPIVRMTTTTIESGDISREDLIASTPYGLYIDNLKHGSGMTTFTIAPNRAYMIRDGKITDPVEVSVITGNVMETLHQIDGIAREVEIVSSPLGGCGKMEQFPLRVGFGGPCIRANGIQVR